MPLPDRPCLRRFLELAQDSQEGRFVYLIDRLPWETAPLRLTRLQCGWLRWFDGEHTLAEIQELASRDAGAAVPLEPIRQLAVALDGALFLEGPRFRARASAGMVRPPSCIGCYEADPRALHEQIEGLFAGPRGPGLPRPVVPDGGLRAALLPHIDYRRGGATFAWGFKEVFERTTASLFVVIGTSHYSPCRFTLTRKDFETPLGILPTDREWVDRLEEHFGDGLLEDEVAHLPEHSIELEVVFLQYYYATRRPIRMVPLLVGSFHDCVTSGTLPLRQPDIARMVQALEQVERAAGEPVCYLISGDLAHIGPKFGDAGPVRSKFLAHSRAQDSALMSSAAAADAEAYFRVIAQEGDARRICGLPPTYTTLAAAAPRRGRLLHYDQ